MNQRLPSGWGPSWWNGPAAAPRCALRGLDFDDVSAQVGQELGAVDAEGVGQVQDADVLKGAGPVRVVHRASLFRPAYGPQPSPRMAVAPATPHSPPVIPAKAGIHRAGRRPFPSTLPPQSRRASDPALTPRHSREGGNPQGGAASIPLTPPPTKPSRSDPAKAGIQKRGRPLQAITHPPSQPRNPHLRGRRASDPPATLTRRRGTTPAAAAAPRSPRPSAAAECSRAAARPRPPGPPPAGRAPGPRRGSGCTSCARR